jgi:hypothetical protein
LLKGDYFGTKRLKARTVLVQMMCAEEKFSTLEDYLEF